MEINEQVNALIGEGSTGEFDGFFITLLHIHNNLNIVHSSKEIDLK